MANLTGILLMLFAMTAAGLLVGGGAGNTQDTNILFRLAFDPSSVGIAEVLSWLFITAALGFAGSLIGVFIFKNDVLIFGVPFTILVGLAHPTMVVFYNKILETFNAQIAAIIVGPLYIIYITTCLAWLRTGR